MNRYRLIGRRMFAPAILVASLLSAFFAFAETITLKNGMQLEGSLGSIAGIANPILSPNGGTNNATGVRSVVLIDDELRRTFVPRLQVASEPAPSVESLERIKIPQRVATTGYQINTIGPILRITPFDEFGRRIFSMTGPKGRLDVVQGITEVTPVYTRVEGLAAEASYVWDMRIATSSLPRATLSRILRTRTDSKDVDARLRVVRLYLQADRIQDAREELEEVIKDFPERAALKEQVDTLRQMGAQRLIKEIKLRREAGQHALAAQMAAQFPVTDVADTTVLTVRDINTEYEELNARYTKLIATMKEQLAQIGEAKTRTALEPFCDEIAQELNIHTIDRMADYARLADDQKMMPDQKISLAVSGWLLGSGAGIENAAVTASLGRVRDLVRDYCKSEKPPERPYLLEQMARLEGSTPSYLAKIVAHMKPPLPLPEVKEENKSKVPGLLEMTIPGAGDSAEFNYLIQLPPEYDPHRRYPCIVTLHGEGNSTANQQLDWWAGAYLEQSGLRAGQASRNGYIVIAPKWTKDHQQSYEYTAREHAAVLFPLRDALKRFSIDTDRVYLSGHSMGGDAAWDIALAHPDLWAGVIPIAANSDKYVSLYSNNARYVPLYFVVGERDGKRLDTNATQWDRYLSRAGYDVAIVEYRGRGHEHFYDEVQRIFEWMKLHRRQFFPSEFDVVTVREGDNFFWWAEVDSFPAKMVVSPYNWPPPKNTPPVGVAGRLLPASNGIKLTTAAGGGRIYLSPELVDFEKRIVITLDGKRVTPPQPSSETLLEDVRTRGDRQHPFWAKVDF